VTVEVLPSIDATRRLCNVTLDLAVGEDWLLGKRGEGRSIIDRVIDRAAAALAVDSVGGAQRVLEMCVDYAKQRMQFGRPIGSFQAIKHRCADMLLLVETSKVASERAAEEIAETPGEPSAAAAIAKAYACDAYAKVGGDGIQTHGGIGFTWEHDIHLYFKRAKLNQVLFGDPAWHRARLASMVLPK
jgi:alkylation response protein AidB-like acyl-CoA dehydrogenase